MISGTKERMQKDFKFDNLEAMDQFFEKPKLPKLN